MFSFNGATKIISVNTGVTSFSAGQVYSAWKQWVQASDNAKYEAAFGNSVGGEPLGGGVSVGTYYFIQNGWVIRPQESSHTLVVSGNLFPVPDTANVFTSTLGNYNVLISIKTSSLTQQVVSGGGSPVTPADVADAVWNKDISPLAANTAAGELKAAKQNAATAVAVSL